MSANLFPGFMNALLGEKTKPVTVRVTRNIMETDFNTAEVSIKKSGEHTCHISKVNNFHCGLCVVFLHLVESEV